MQIQKGTGAEMPLFLTTKNMGERKPRVRVKGKFVSYQVERKLQKEAGKIDIYNPTPEQKKLIDDLLSTDVTYEVNNFKVLEMMMRYNNIKINGRPVEQKLGIKFIGQLSQLLKEKMDAAILLYKVSVNEAERSMNIQVPDYR